MLVLAGIEGAQRTHFRHAPGMDHGDAELFVEGADHGRRCRRAADDQALDGRQPELVPLQVLQQAEPDGRHAGRHGDAFLFEDRIQAGAVQVRPRHDQFGAGQGTGIGQAPGIDVEHRHGGQDAVAGRGAQGVGQA